MIFKAMCHCFFLLIFVSLYAVITTKLTEVQIDDSIYTLLLMSGRASQFLMTACDASVLDYKGVRPSWGGYSKGVGVLIPLITSNA